MYVKEVGLAELRRHESVRLAIEIINGVQGALIASGQGPFIPERLWFCELAADIEKYLENGSES